MFPSRWATAGRSLATVTVLLALTGATRPARACASCGCGDQTLTVTGIERPYKNRVCATLEERYGSLTLGDAEVGQQVTFLRSTLALSWSPMNRLTLGPLLPWVTSWI